MRRTVITVPMPPGVDIRDWPLVIDIDEELNLEPDVGHLLLSPANADASAPRDAVTVRTHTDLPSLMVSSTSIWLIVAGSTVSGLSGQHHEVGEFALHDASPWSPARRTARRPRA
jgi:hypothetical protein